MSKNRNRQKNSNQEVNKTTNEDHALEEQKKLESMSQEKDEIVEEYLTQEDLDNTKKEDINTKSLKVRNVVNQFNEMIIAKNALKDKKSHYESLEEDLLEKQIEIDEERKEIQKKEEFLKKTQNDYDTKLEEYNQLRMGNFSNIINKELIDKYEKSLRGQEELLAQKISELDGKYSEYTTLITQTKIKFQDDYKEKFTARDEELQKLEESLKKQKEQIKFDRSILDEEREDFDFDEKLADKKADKAIAQQIINFETSISNLTEQNSAYYERVNELEEKLKSLGSDDPMTIKQKLQDSRKKIAELESMIDFDEEMDKKELERLQVEESEWLGKRREYEDEYRALKQHYDNQKVQVGEVEYHKFQIEAYEKRFELQEEALNQMKDEYDELLEKANSKEVFISCKNMDQKYADKGESDLYDDSFSSKWLDTLKHVIAGITEEELYYHPDTLRSFIAGLAMSQLTILQGISGTGKTSLPKAFIQAICGKASEDGDEHYEVVEVQSGWKDRQDLLGYYNTFEKKYYESSFLKALYKANTPKYRNKPFFIILDEMNLSHPEHYFADLLSMLEETNRDKHLLKICDKVNNNPRYMKEENNAELLLKIPDNVWFIGTANHDETTVGFAPKTYDRANIMEMPKNPDYFKRDTNIEQEEVEQSNKNFLNELKNPKGYNNIDFVVEYINEGDFKELCNDLDIGWGNRLDKHIRRFVPIFIALGGSEADAVDHMISSKILRTLESRYDLRAKKGELELLKSELEFNFKDLFNKKATKSIAIVKAAIKKTEE